MARFNVNGSNDFYIDTTDAMARIKQLELALSQRQIHDVLYRTLNETGRYVKTIMRKDVPHDYAVTATWVGKHVGNVQISTATFGANVTAIVPLDGKKGTIGGIFKMTGTRGRPKKRKKGLKAYKINAKIIKADTSELPEKMKRQGGNPPFIAKGAVYTRRTNQAYPVVRVVGLAMPQMPLKRSEAEVRKDINKRLESRLNHHLDRLLVSL